MNTADTVSGTPQQTIIGVDVGGTFTDFVFLNADGAIQVSKRPTTPGDPSEAVAGGLRSWRAETPSADRFTLSHGATVATNALLQRRGANTALVTTAGFGDILHIGRQTRSELYRFVPSRREPLIPREHIFEVSERIDWQGNILTSLDREGVERVLSQIDRLGIRSLAVCFLFAHLNPIHELEVAKMAHRYGIEVSLSSDIAPEPREYERASTTVANAFVAPLMKVYLDRLEEAARAAGASRVHVMQSDGGTLSPQQAAAHGVKTALSGPAGGVIAAARIGQEAGFARILTFDMGGTSTDVAPIIDGHCPIVTDSLLGDIPLRTPMLDIHTVGAGGGSIAWIDRAGALRVGPHSAGADPGPAAYGVGEQLTVTDANILLGRLPADTRLADSLSVDPARVQTCFGAFANRLGLHPESVARGIVAIAEAAMARALRHISVERGLAAPDFALCSFGGAGGLHACALAEQLSMQHVIVPRFPGALSALGLALAPIRREFAKSLPILVIGASAEAAVTQAQREVLAGAQPFIDSLASERLDVLVEQFVDARYSGQSYELRTALRETGLAAVARDFHALHAKRYGHSDPSAQIEITAIRVVVSGRRSLPPLQTPLPSQWGSPVRETHLFDRDGWVEAAVYRREELAPGQIISGPCVVLQSDATTFIPSRWRGAADTAGNLILTDDARARRYSPGGEERG